MGFLDLILDNIFLIFIIISGIIGFLGSNKEEQKKKQRPVKTNTPQRQPVPAPSRTRTETKRPIESPRRQAEQPAKPQVTVADSIEAEQKVQMERLQERFGRSTSPDEKAVTSNQIGQDLTESGSLQPAKYFSEEQEILRKDIRKSLKNKGLINGIIMAEVLGKPRSLKPFESPTLERYKK